MSLDSSFVEELGELRRDLGRPQPMRMRSRWKRTRSWLQAAPIDLVRFRKPPKPYPDELWLSLYPVDAPPGARPVVEVSVEPTDTIEAVPQGTTVTVFGTVDAGHAIVVREGDHVLWPVHPGTIAFGCTAAHLTST